MSQFIETIKAVDGEVFNFSYHKRRATSTLSSCLNTERLPFSKSDLIDYLQAFSRGKYKLRVVYDAEKYRLEAKPYLLKAINSVKLIESNSIEYGYKLNDRSFLHSLFELREDHDDILIIKNGLVTDSYYANCAFLKEGRWYTPHKPLLQGTKRAALLDERRIIEMEIRQDDIQSYEQCRLFNAMIEFGEIEFGTDKIF